MTDAVARDSEEAIAKGSQSFAAAALLFDPATREDCVMLYHWCRHADDVIDGQALGHEQAADFREGQAERLDTLRADTINALRGGKAEGSFRALQRVAARAEFPERHPLDLIAGFEMDVTGRSYQSLADTLDYAYHVAGVVGVMMAMVMGVRSEPVLDRASDLGIAFQLTNIARDVIEDARAGRVYLPAEWLHSEGLGTPNGEDRGRWPMLHRLAVRLVEEAEPYYASALAGLPALKWRSAWAIAAARRVYRAIGIKLRRASLEAWANRISTSKAEKLGLVALALMDVLVSRFRRGPGPERRGLYQRPR